MLHVRMIIPDKQTLFAGVARVLGARAYFRVYNVMRTGDGGLTSPLPWAANAGRDAIASLEEHRGSRTGAGFEIRLKRECRDEAVDYFQRQRAQVASAAGPPAWVFTP